MVRNLRACTIRCSSPVAEVLPSWRMPGLCATVLVHKMAAIQNALLEDYHTFIRKEE